MDIKTILEIWDSYKTIHSVMDVRKEYYKGNQKFLTKPYNSDGSKKNDVPVNFINYIIDQHTAASTKIPYTFTFKDESDYTPAIEELATVIDENDLSTLDTEHFKTALTCGYSVEVHSYDGEQIKVQQYCPTEWAFVTDTNDVIQLAIHKALIPKFTFFQGNLLTKDTEVITTYDSATISTFIKSADESAYRFFDQVEHLYNQVPIVLFHINKQKQPFLSNCLLGQNDTYNKIVNARIDEVEFNIDSFIKITGFDTKQPDAAEILKQMKRDRFIILSDSNSNFEFLTKSNEAAKYNDSLADARKAIFNQGFVPDIEEILGTSAISGIALTYKFTPMKQLANNFQKYIEKGLRDRINLFNHVWEFLGMPTLENYNIKMDFYLPVDTLAERTSYKEIAPFISKRTLLSLIPEVTNVEEEIARLEEEASAAQAATAPGMALAAPAKPFEANPAQRTADRVDAVSSQSAAFQDKLKKSFTPTLKADVKSKIIDSGKLKEFITEVGGASE